MKKKGTLSNIMLTLVFLIGLSLLLYPSFSNYWNSMHQTRAIADYSEEIAHMDSNVYEKYLSAAREYNESVFKKWNQFILTEEEEIDYRQQLSISVGGVMGYIEIPSIQCALPIYHGTDEAILQVAVGHLDWSSIPVGGENTHCVLSGHRGLPSAKLFTDLDELVVGDIFMIRVLNELLTYEVDQILIVEPADTKDLLIQEGKDLCTLVTCTPYGINSHRLLVRGHRIDNTPEAIAVRVTADAIQIEPLLVACIIGIPILLLLFILLFMSDSHSDDRRR